MLRLLTLLLFFLPSLALAQGGPVQQTGPVTPGHIAVWATNGVVQGGGPATNGKVTNLGILGTGLPSCINDVPEGSIGGWHQLCFGSNVNGTGALLSYQALGGATPLPLQCSVNGTTYNCGASAGPIGGTNTQVQFNNSAALGGDPTFTFNTTTKLLGFAQAVIGAATGGAQGTGTVNAAGYFLNGVPFGGGAGNPAGSNQQIQFNNSSVFGADPTFTINPSTHAVGASSLALSLSGTALILPAGSNASIGGTLAVTSGMTLTNPTSASTLTMSGNNSTMTNTFNSGIWDNRSGFVSGTTNGSLPSIMSWLTSDDVNTTSVLDMFNLEQNIAPAGNAATGPRLTFNILHDQIGTGTLATTLTNAAIIGTALTFTSNTGTVRVGQTIWGPGVTHPTTIVSGSGLSWVVTPSQTTPATGTETMITTGTFTFQGQSGALRITNDMSSNLGGTPTAHNGAGTTFNIECVGFATATSAQGCLDAEFDLQSFPGGTLTNATISGTTVTFASHTGTLWSGQVLTGANGDVTPGTVLEYQIDATDWAISTSQTISTPETMKSNQSFIQNGILLLTHQANDQTEGLLGGSYGIKFADQSGSTIGHQVGIVFGDQTAAWPISTGNSSGGPGRLIAAEPSFNNTLYPPTAGGMIDVSIATFHGCIHQEPYHATCALQATGITSATRLTSDGACKNATTGCANGYIRDAYITAGSSGYTAEPTWTVTGCTGAVINSGPLAVGGAVGEVGVYTAGSACKAEATVAPATGSAAAKLLIAGNTLNLPINSTNLIQCSVSANDTGPGAIGWTISFTATMGATASTTAIVGSPTWTAIGTDAALTLAAPTADTTLGAINITLTPSAVTATIGGSCTITSSQQIVMLEPANDNRPLRQVV